MRVRVVGVLIVLMAVMSTAGASARAQGQTTPPPPAQNPTPPAQEPVPIGSGRVTAPRPVSQVKPDYTPEAMRNRIQGVVQLRAIVERDGSVSGVEVLMSLDPMYGLDQAAIDALKQWRFQPGLVDGNPVRVAITVSLNFALSDNAPVQAWPDGFAGASIAPDATQETADTRGMHLTVSRPGGWTIRRDGPPAEWVGLRSNDGLMQVSVMRPDDSPSELHFPASEAIVQRLAETVRRSQTARDVETTATGQIQAPNAFWVWSALKVPVLQTPPGTSANAFPVAEARLWMFTRTVNSRLVGVLCTLLMPRGLDAPGIDARMKQAAGDFGAILNSLTIEAVPAP